MGHAVRSSWVCATLMVAAFSGVIFAQTQPDTEHIKTLEFFAGQWSCLGKFANGKPIAAKEHFENILNGAFVLFQHDDIPPHQYHALAEWGWDRAANDFIAVFEDSSGGVRVFRSSGWTGSTLQWLGGSLPDASDQRFELERLNPKQYRVSYSFKRDGNWVAVDSSVCSLEK